MHLHRPILYAANEPHLEHRLHGLLSSMSCIFLIWSRESVMISGATQCSSFVFQSVFGVAVSGCGCNPWGRT